MFSIEVTSTYYATRSYWFAASTSAVGGLLFKFLWGWYQGYPGGEKQTLILTCFSPMYVAGLRPLYSISLDYTVASWPDVLALVILGTFLGFFLAVYLNS